MTQLTDAKRSALVRKLEKLAKLANEIDAEAKQLFGPQGNLFYESAGSFHVMDGDAEDGSQADRLQHIKVSSISYCRMGSGAW